MPEAAFIDASQPVEPKPTDWPKIILAAALGLAFLAGAAYVGYWYGKQETKSQLPITHISPISPLPSPAPDSTVGWERFSSNHLPSLGNEGYFVTKFSLKLPPETNFQCDMSACWEKSVSLPTGARLAIIEGGKETFFPNETWASILGDLRKNKIAFSEIMVDNKPAVKAIASGGVFPLATPALEEKNYGVIIKSGEENWISIFIYRYNTINEKSYQIEPSSDDISLFNQILSTFKFLD